MHMLYINIHGCFNNSITLLDNASANVDVELVESFPTHPMFLVRQVSNYGRFRFGRKPPPPLAVLSIIGKSLQRPLGHATRGPIVALYV